jgi:ABC-type transport system involved in multi-copper enzyme maturation permease subunit
MDLSHQLPPSRWYGLLWKDFQLIRATLVAVTSGLFLVQLIFLMVSFATNDESLREGMLGGISILASIAPILFAIGCSGMLVGHERQSGTWAWSSSLPVSWRQALASKLLVSLVGSAFVGVVLAVVPVILLATGRLVVGNTSLAAVYASGLTAVALLEVMVCFYVASLMIRETLTALVVAGLALSIGQLVVALGVVVALKNAGFEESRAEELFGYVSSVLIVLVGAIAMAAAFRWRWGAGQATELSLWPQTSAAAAPLASKYAYTSEVAPSEWWMLVRHAFSNSWTMRLCVLVAVALIALLGGVDETSLIAIFALTAGIFGLSTFEGDQTLQRFRFLADRGTSPWKLVASRLSVAVGWALLAGGIVMVAFAQRGLWQSQPGDVLMGCGLGLVAFWLSAFASLCFRKAVIAATVAAVVSIGWLSIYISTLELIANSLFSGMAEFNLQRLTQLVCTWTPATMLVLCVATFRLARRWLVLENSRLPLQFVWVTTLAFLLPVVGASNSFFLLIPNVPWQGVSLAELSQRSAVVPDLKSIREPQWPLPIRKLSGKLSDLYETMPVENDWTNAKSINAFRTGLDQAFSESSWSPEQVDEQHGTSTGRVDFAQQLEPFATQFEEQLRSSSAVLDVEEATASYSDWICSTAILACIVSKSGEPQLAERLWRINRNLQQFAEQCDLLATASARSFAMLMLQSVSKEERAAMGGPEVFDSLIPIAADERAAVIKNTREWATFGREFMRGKVEPQGRFSDVNAPQSARLLIRFYPPARWFLERKLAIDMQVTSQLYSSQRKDFLTGPLRDALLQKNP